MSTDPSRFPPMKNDKVLTLIRGQQTDKIPVWVLIKQAGPYLPEFDEKLRGQTNLYHVYTNPALACEITLMPVKRFNFDAAIIFSDRLLVPHALGVPVVFTTPSTVSQLLDLDDVDKLQTEGAVDRLKFVGDTITMVRQQLGGMATVFGYACAPWTLMALMIEGGLSHRCVNAKKWLYLHEAETYRLLQVLTDVVGDFCAMQARAGAQVIQLFDKCADVLDKDTYAQFCVPALAAIRQRVRSEMQRQPDGEDVPMAVFASGLLQSFEELVDAGYEVVGLDWRTEPIFVRSSVLPRSVCLQGNLDPTALFAPDRDIRRMVFSMLKKFEGSRVIVTLGHDIFPNTPLQSMYAFIEAVKDYNRNVSDDSDTSSSSSSS